MFLASVPLAMAGSDNTWSRLNQQWKRIQNSQKKQAENFRALERETAGLGRVPKYEGGIDKAKQATPHYCSHCGQLHAAAHYCSYCGQLHE